MYDEKSLHSNIFRLILKERLEGVLEYNFTF